MSDDRIDQNRTGNGWLNVIEAEPPKFHCPVMQTQLTGPCRIRSCGMWNSDPRSYCCTAAFASMKAANSAERLQATSSKEKRGALRSSADGKLSFYDIAHIYGISRQRVEGHVQFGKQVMETLAPLFARLGVGGESGDQPKRRLGSPNLFTHTNPVAHTDERGTTRVCVACESVIEPEDPEMVLAVLDRYEVPWCSRECAKEFPIDAWLISTRYKRHYVSIALEWDVVDDRSRVREVTPERMDILRLLAVQQGY